MLFFSGLYLIQHHFKNILAVFIDFNMIAINPLPPGNDSTDPFQLRIGDLVGVFNRLGYSLVFGRGVEKKNTARHVEKE